MTSSCDVAVFALPQQEPARERGGGGGGGSGGICPNFESVHASLTRASSPHAVSYCRTRTANMTGRRGMRLTCLAISSLWRKRQRIWTRASRSGAPSHAFFPMQVLSVPRSFVTARTFPPQVEYELLSEGGRKGGGGGGSSNRFIKHTSRARVHYQASRE